MAGQGPRQESTCSRLGRLIRSRSWGRPRDTWPKRIVDRKSERRKNLAVAFRTRAYYTSQGCWGNKCRPVAHANMYEVEV